MILLLSGGVGGAKLVEGFAAAIGGEKLKVVVNTGDDVELYGLRISPDIDIMLYTLGGIVNWEQGWGIADDSWHVHRQLHFYGGPAWFQLGDRDLATQLFRTELLKAGKTPSEVSRLLAQCLGVKAEVIPMTDDPVETRIVTPEGDLHFQEYLVQRGSRDPVKKIYFKGIEKARPSPGFLAGLEEAAAVIICPSNPLVSIGPILALPGVKDKLRDLNVPRIAVSPMVGRRVFKGPLARMLEDLGIVPGAFQIAQLYAGMIDYFVIDEADYQQKELIESDLGIKVLTTNIIMQTKEDKKNLALFLLKKTGLLT
ncbi:MAG: 2-phospho-L-lactate transferase [Bacillota bacterium]